MRFLRVFTQQGALPNWSETNPPLASILQKCFDINRKASRIQPVSVFQVRSEREEVEAVSALFQVSPSTPEKRFGVIVEEGDCLAAGVQIDRTEKGNTGITIVDGRHANFTGTQKQFGTLIGQIVKGMWEGEQRLRIYPAQQIALQLAVFSRLPDGEIDDASRDSSLTVLNRVAWHTFTEKRAEVRGRLADEDPHEIVSLRSLESSSLLRRIWRLIYRKP
jgi:hypothetical protein